MKLTLGFVQGAQLAAQISPYTTPLVSSRHSTTFDYKLDHVLKGATLPLKMCQAHMGLAIAFNLRCSNPNYNCTIGFLANNRVEMTILSSSFVTITSRPLLGSLPRETCQAGLHRELISGALICMYMCLDPHAYMYLVSNSM
jgi:hypothetical protein